MAVFVLDHQGKALMPCTEKRARLLLARGRVLSRPQIEEHLYSWGDTVESNAVEVYVHHLRKKLGQKVIVTMRGVGYFMPQEQE